MINEYGILEIIRVEFHPKIMQIVSFDFGVKKIGVAGPDKTRTSSPLEIVLIKITK